MLQMMTLKYCLPQNSEKFQSKLDDILCEIEFIKKGKVKYANVPSVFDIESSSFYVGENKQCCMYAWCFGINGRCIRGRTWDEFITIINRIVKIYNLSLEKRFIIYVHNLNFEFQWFKRYFEWEKVFSIDTRKPIYAITKNGIEFRCSYLLSGYSLKKLGENLVKYKVEKLVGDLDYKLIRHSKTPLTDKEWHYVLNDGLVVMAYIQEEIERLGDITKIPLTKTGYVRNLCREKCLKGENKFEYVRLLKNLTLDVETYNELKRVFTGGFTHANVNYVGKVMKNVHSYDFTSSYPAVMLSEKFPMSKPFKVKIKDEEDFRDYLNAYCCMFDCTFKNIRSKVSYDNYISISRCFKAEHYVLNNGRVIEADLISISLTEQDFFIIYEMYEWDFIEVSNMYCFYKDYLPKDFILAILDLYVKKTTLKNVDGKEYEYLKSKEMVNSCFGMCVTDPCKDENVYENDTWSIAKADVKELLEKYNKNRNRVLYYPWGVWVTTYAKRNLFTGIFEFKDDYIYSDTDSLKVLNIEKHTKYIDDYNKTITKKISDCLKHYNINPKLASPKTIKGVEKPLGVWDYEGCYSRFKTLGAKRYMYEQDGEIHITIAGVAKESGIRYLKHTFKTNTEIFKNFEEDLYFPSSYIRNENGKEIEDNASGKLCHTYIDSFMSGEVIDYLGNKGIYNEYSGVHLENTDYTLSLDNDFIKLILGIKGGHMI